MLIHLRAVLSLVRAVCARGSVVGSLLRVSCVAVLALGCLAALSACGTDSEVEIEIRIHNTSKLDFTDISVAGQPYGDIEAGETSEYKKVKLSFRYAALELKADGHRVAGQTLNLGAERFTYEIDIVDLEAGPLAIEIIPE